jgi:hypothetical protein
MKLYLDDVRNAPDDSWMVVREYYEFMGILQRDWDKITKISLDHDLGDENRNGYDVLCYIEDYVHDEKLTCIPKIHIHTANASARPKML